VGRNSEHPAVYNFGEFSLNSAVLTYRGTVVPLTPKAVTTLILLVSRAPAVVGKDEIMATVWPDTFVVESSLARNISLIRKALEDRSDQGPYIETIPKRGYRFVAAITEDAFDVSVAAPSISTATLRFPLRRPLLMAVAGLVLAIAVGATLYRRPVASPVSDPDPSTLIGWHLFHKVTLADTRRALSAFEKAVAVHPESAIAHAGLAAALLTLPRLAEGGADWFERARAESATALRLDPHLGAAHASHGTVQMVVDWDFVAAEKSFRRAIELDPSSILALVNLSQLLSATARLNEALVVAQRAVRIDPVSPMIGVQVGIVLYSQGRFEDAARQFQSVLDRERSFTLAHYYLGLTYGYLGRFAEALTHLGRADLHPGVLRTDRAWVALRAGDRKSGERAYDVIKAEVGAGSVSPSALLLLAVSLGKLDDAFGALETSFQERNPDLLNLQSDPRLEGLRTDARYHNLVRRLHARKDR
jgi:DNA-binding winged helix-turn-helix (wHTH) protein/Flp pilus assembly protein TadD